MVTCAVRMVLLYRQSETSLILLKYLGAEKMVIAKKVNAVKARVRVAGRYNDCGIRALSNSVCDGLSEVDLYDIVV